MIKAIYFFGLTIVVGCLVTPVQSQEIDWKSVKILWFTKNGKGYVHDNIANSVKAIKEMSDSLSFTVDVRDQSDVFTKDKLAGYDVVVFSNTNNDVFDTEEQRKAFQEYIRGGGGFVGIHSASGTERNWPWFKQLLGGTFYWHEPFQPFSVRVLQSKHPSVAHLPAVWQRKGDECYYLKEMAVDLTVIAVNDLETIKGTNPKRPITFGSVFPSVWCHEFDGGRAWYTSLGHQKEDYNDPVFRQHILGGIIWAMDANRN